LPFFDQILSTDARPKQPKANIATELTNVSDGAKWESVKELAYIVMQSVSAQTIPTNLLDEGIPLSSFKRPEIQLITDFNAFFIVLKIFG